MVDDFKIKFAMDYMRDHWAMLVKRRIETGGSRKSQRLQITMEWVDISDGEMIEPTAIFDDEMIDIPHRFVAAMRDAGLIEPDVSTKHLMDVADAKQKHVDDLRKLIFDSGDWSKRNML